MQQKVDYTPGQWMGIGGRAPRYQSGSQQSVVHDTLNNQYYGTQSFDQITKGLTDNIARTQAKLAKGYDYRTYAKDTMWERQERYNYSAKDKQNLSKSISNQQKYLSSITKDNYTKEADTYFDSYEAYTQDYNNIYQRTYNNSVQAERNKATTARNAEIEKQNAAQLERNRLQIEANDRMAAQNAKQERENERPGLVIRRSKVKPRLKLLRMNKGQPQTTGQELKL